MAGDSDRRAALGLRHLLRTWFSVAENVVLLLKLRVLAPLILGVRTSCERAGRMVEGGARVRDRSAWSAMVEGIAGMVGE